MLTLSGEVPGFDVFPALTCGQPCPYGASVSHPAGLEQSTLLLRMKNILAKRDNAKAERAKIRPSGSIWQLCAQAASLPAVGPLRAQVTCRRREIIASSGALWG